MRREIEVKILNIDRGKMRRRLERLGARRIVPPTRLREVYFTRSNAKSLFSSFRLRSEGQRALLTVKRKMSDDTFLDHEEIEVTVDDVREARKLITALGFTAFREREKIREEYQKGDVKIAIDQYPQLQPYLEIEGRSRRAVRAFLRDLGFAFSATSAMTATEIIRSAGLDPNHLLFRKNGRTIRR